MTTVLLVRHGLTAVTGRTLSGWTPGIGLDERGTAQARALAARLAAPPTAGTGRRWPLTNASVSAATATGPARN